ncbi:unnamed protein product [Schistocephalus solidus]|uniref:G protein gamma domain-containing protein n=1 Tax=Schistocephalus solidus TaxID=70667 RepID=A0A183SAF5_SCHSO|nr:unnamed protein product [Schistocephalus solidus]
MSAFGVVNSREEEIGLKRDEVQMLKTCCDMKRMKLSEAISDIKNYCFEHADADQLIHAPKDDPFKNKRKCSIL